MSQTLLSPRQGRLHAGLTLVEMAVAFTVIALVTGGIFVGRSLIRSAELQTVISDANRYKQAAKLFRDKYKYLPGDFPNAASIWGTDASCNTTTIPNSDSAPSNHAPKMETCGGDGNGFIAGYIETSASQGSPSALGWPTPANVGTAATREAIRAWQHLANAKLIEGTYSGAASDATGGYEPGVNVPAGPDRAVSGYALFHAASIGPNGRDPGGVPVNDVYPGDYGHIIGYGYARGVPIRRGMVNPILSAADAASIDEKSDDGRPATGNVRSFPPANASSPNCADSSDPAIASYRSDGQGVACALIFITGS